MAQHSMRGTFGKTNPVNRRSIGRGVRSATDADLSLLSLIAELRFDSASPARPPGKASINFRKTGTHSYSKLVNNSADSAKIRAGFSNHSGSFNKKHIAVYLGTDGDNKTRVENLTRMWHAAFFGIDWPNKVLCTDIMNQMLTKMTDASRQEVLLNLLLQQKKEVRSNIVSEALLKMDFSSRAAVFGRLPLPPSAAPSIPRKRPANASICVTGAPKPAVASNRLKEYWVSDRHKRLKPSSTPAQPDPFSRPPEVVINAQTCLKCKQKIPTGLRRPYTHQKSNGSFYLIFRCCGQDYSDLRNLSGERNKHFQGLKPTKSQLIAWAFDDKFKKWRLMARGQSWTRCNHCKALYKNFSGKSGHHPKSKCPWAHLSEMDAEEAAAKSVCLAVANVPE